MARKIGEEQADGQTPIQDTSGLIPKIHLQSELNIHESQNYTNAITKFQTIALNEKTVSFTYEWLKQVHRDMLGEVWEWAGDPRKSNTTIGVEKEKIGAEVHRLLFELKEWESQKMPAAEIAVRLHHRLVWIHPFQNGNGRWARLITNIYLRKNNLSEIHWPLDPDKFRSIYISALKAADGGNFAPLTQLHLQYSNPK